MPLPLSDPKAVWPPQSMANILAKMSEWDAWYANNIDQLQAVYGGGAVGDPGQTGYFASDKGGFRAAAGRALKRWFVGEPARGNERNTKVTLPIAAQVCQASSDLLFSDPFTVKVKDETTQKRVAEMLDDDFHTTIAESAEAAANLGGTYLRVTWDPALLDYPFPTIVHADHAVPEFRFGRLWAVTFWTDVQREGGKVWRHLERHERNGRDKDANGVILHGLYEGEDDKLGIRVDLDTLAATAPLSQYTDLNTPGTIDTRSPGLAVEYVPNQTPNRQWRNDPVGQNLGRSDLDGTEHLMDQAAETMSDLMRARRVARARIFFARSLAKSGGPGQGTILDTNQEVFVPTEKLGGSSGDVPMSQQVQLVQPEFDPAGYLTTIGALLQQIVEMAGYSAQTFGFDSSSSTRSTSTGTRTATEVEARERRSLMTRARKIREWQPALVRFIEKLLAVDNAFFAQKNNPAGLEVDFSDGVQETQLTLGQTALAMYQGESASRQERVKVLHPDWDDPDVQAEVARLKEEFGSGPMPDPAMTPFGGDDDGGDGDDEPVG